jgi:hypothetical protein
MVGHFVLARGNRVYDDVGNVSSPPAVRCTTTEYVHADSRSG